MFVNNLIKSILPNSLLRNPPQHSTPISPQCHSPVTTQPLPQNPSTVNRERVTQLSGNSNFSLGTNYPEEFANDEDLKTWILLLGRQEQTTFLKRVCASGLILKSFARKTVPPKLMFMWQEEHLQKQITEINNLKTHFNDFKWKQLSHEKRCFLRKWKNRKKEKLIKKFKKFKNHHKEWQKCPIPKSSIFKKRIDRQRYKTSKNNKIIEVSKSKILNFSNFELSDTHYLILGRGFNFVPTPTPSRLKTSEWNNCMQHIRLQEWGDILSEEENREYEKVPKKCKLKKTSRPAELDLSDKAKAYTHNVLTGMRSFDNWAKLKRQNLQKHEIKELQKLKKACNTSVMLCKSDKDSKLILVDLVDYKRRVQQEISKNYIPTTVPDKKRADEIKHECRELCKVLHNYEIISDQLLEGTVGVKFNHKKQDYQPLIFYADQFYYNFDKMFAHVYPLWKTHKAAHFPDINSIPMRLVTAANRLPTTKVMAMLEHVLAGPMKKYCGSEYTKDSSDFIKSMTDNQIYDAENLSIICFDVEALYPNASRDTVILGIRECLALDNWNYNAIEAYINLVKLCMREIYISFDQRIYTADSGIVTGAPNSVSLANCMLRFITRKIDLHQTLIWKRYIDDIICFIKSRDKQVLEQFINSVKSKFREFDLNLTVRILNPEDQENDSAIEFLDVNHSFDDSDHVQTGLFVKPTAKNATYLHPSSYHPSFIPDGILKSELIRIRKISSNETTFKSGVAEIQNKATRSSFPLTVINTALEMIQEWDDHKRNSLLEGSIAKTVDKSLTWVTQLPTCIREQFANIKKYLPKQVKLRFAYQKPDSIQSMCFNPRTLEADTNAESGPCGKCLLCGNWGKGDSMVETTNILKVKIENKIKKFAIKTKLTCVDAGIYVASCNNCDETYVGKTMTSFKTRFSGHRSLWKAGKESNKDETALLDHYRNNHPTIYEDWCFKKIAQHGFDKSFSLVFIDKVGSKLSEQEDFWKQRLQSKINRCNIITPAIMN